MACIAIVWNQDFLVQKLFSLFLWIHHSGFRLERHLSLYSAHIYCTRWQRMHSNIHVSGHTAKLYFPGPLKLVWVSDQVMAIECDLILCMVCPGLIYKNLPHAIFHLMFLWHTWRHMLKMVVSEDIRSLDPWVTVWTKIPLLSLSHWSVMSEH